MDYWSDAASLMFSGMCSSTQSRKTGKKMSRNSDFDLQYHVSLSSVNKDFSNLLHKARLEVQIMWEDC
jgi:hypothetical protein